MTKQQQIDALTAENVRMSELLQRIADILPIMESDFRDYGRMTPAYIIAAWLDDLARMGITQRGQEQTS